MFLDYFTQAFLNKAVKFREQMLTNLSIHAAYHGCYSTRIQSIGVFECDYPALNSSVIHLITFDPLKHCKKEMSRYILYMMSLQHSW